MSINASRLLRNHGIEALAWCTFLFQGVCLGWLSELGAETLQSGHFKVSLVETQLCNWGLQVT